MRHQSKAGAGAHFSDRFSWPGRINTLWCALELFPAADEYFRFRVSQDLKPGAAKHCLSTGAIGYPPIRRITRIFFLYKVHLGKSPAFEDLRLPKMVIIRDGLDILASPLHGLEYQ